MKYKNHFDEWLKVQIPICEGQGADIMSPGQMMRMFNNLLVGPESYRTAMAPAMKCMLANKRAYYQHGCNSFIVSEKMCDMFEQTDVHNVKKEHIKVPYEGFYISIPEGRYQIWGGKRTRYHDSWGIYVRYGCDWEDPKFLVVSVIAGPNERSTAFDDDALTWVGIDLEEIQHKGSIERSVIQRMGMADILKPWNAEVGTMPADNQTMAEQLDKEQIEVLVKAIRVSINLILYLNHAGDKKTCPIQTKRKKKREWLLEGSDKMSPAKRAKAVLKATPISPANYYFVGDMNEQAGSSVEMTKHWVRGHWHTYRVGKGRKEAILKWVQPYQKGSVENKGQGTREYKVTKENRDERR